jgi:hypothetical protein
MLSVSPQLEKPSINLSILVAEKPNSIAVTSMKSVAKQIPSSSLNNMEAAQRGNMSAGQAAQMAIQVLAP